MVKGYTNEKLSASIFTLKIQQTRRTRPKKNPIRSVWHRQRTRKQSTTLRAVCALLKKATAIQCQMAAEADHLIEKLLKGGEI